MFVAGIIGHREINVAAQGNGHFTSISVNVETFANERGSRFSALAESNKMEIE